MELFNHLTIKNNNGVSLIEMLAAVTVFVITVGAISGIFISAIRSQRRILATQELLDQTSYVLEYMGRALRMAKKDSSSPPICLTTCGSGCNYENPGGDISKIRFIDYNDVCTEYFLDPVTGQLKKTAGGTTSELTSTKLYVNSLRFRIWGEDQNDFYQPRVTIFLEISGRETIGRPKIQIQTSISQRPLDIR